jgi:hypothetical protein
VALRNCTVSVSDLDGIEHTVEATASTLYGAVAAALAALRDDGWVGEIGNGLTTVSVSSTSLRLSTMCALKISWRG